MTTGVSSAIQTFLDRNSRDGLFLRFARGRTRDFVMRQTMTGVGALALSALGELWMGPLAILMAVAGELIDVVALRMLVQRRLTAEPWARRLAALTGAIQAMTISACVVLSWRFVDVPEARFFAAVFLMSAVINAGLVRRYFPEGIDARLIVYAITGLSMLGYDLWHHIEREMVGDWFFILSVLIIGYTATLFIRAVEKGQSDRLRFERALLDEQKALEHSQETLVETVRQAERLALVARHANDSVVFTTPDGRIEWVNEGFTRITGYSFEEAVGERPGSLLNGPETSPQALAHLIASQKAGRPCRLELQNRTKDGRLIWMEISMAPVLAPDDSTDVFIAVERDITAAKAHADELAAARQVAESAVQAKSQFLATMSHEIRTPMNGVIGVAELLAETELTPTQGEYVTTIIDSGRALLTIINDVLDLSKLQAGKADLRPEPFSVAESVSRSIDLLRPTAKAKGIGLIAEVPLDLPRHYGDAGRLRQILLNLMGNAVKFTSEGQVTVTLTMEPGPKTDLLRIAIADTGIGIAPDRVSHVFESFTQADSAIARQFGGTGLGLTISRLLAQQMGGDIEVTSVLGKGSVFTLTVALPRPTAIEEAAGLIKPVTAPKTNLRILVAEDNRTNMMIARKILERSVATMAEATNGRIALELYCELPPDLVLMDVSMPEMDGLTATRAIRAHEAKLGLPRCPIVALTAYSSSEQGQACLEAGMDEVLTKPLVRAELYLLLERIAAERDRFDLPPSDALDRAANGGQSWSISPPESTITTGKSTRSSGH